MGDLHETAMSVPLDSDGFLRRECPTCERQFKWLPTGDEDESEAQNAETGYFCPYCAVEAPVDAWLTAEQVEHAKEIVAFEVVRPELEKLGHSIRGVGRSSGGSVSASVSQDLPQKPEPLEEPDDMRRVDFKCHSGEPVKVSDDWGEAVHCLVCGTAA